MTNKTMTRYYANKVTLVGALIEGQHIMEFVWNIHPFDWYSMPSHFLADEYGNILQPGEFRDILLKTRTWNMASIGRMGPINDTE